MPGEGSQVVRLARLDDGLNIGELIRMMAFDDAPHAVFLDARACRGVADEMCEQRPAHPPVAVGKRVDTLETRVHERGHPRDVIQVGRINLFDEAARLMFQHL